MIILDASWMGRVYPQSYLQRLLQKEQFLMPNLQKWKAFCCWGYHLSKTKLFPVDTRKGCFSIKRLHFKGKALGLSVRPSFPKAELTMHLVEGARDRNLPLPEIVDSPTIDNPSFDDPDTQSRYRAYWRLQSR